MKKIKLLLIIMILLSGCTQKKQKEPIEQTFKNIQFELYAGELDVNLGDEIIYSHQNGQAIEYTISNDTLYIINRSKGNVFLTLPKDYVYDSISILSVAGDLNIKESPSTKQMDLDIQYGNVVLSKAHSSSTNIELKEGYLFSSGELGENVNIHCLDGYIKLRPSTTKDQYNFNLNLTKDAYLNLGGSRYDNMDFVEQIYNRKQQTMNINIQQGNVIIKFKAS